MHSTCASEVEPVAEGEKVPDRHAKMQPLTPVVPLRENVPAGQGMLVLSSVRRLSKWSSFESREFRSTIYQHAVHTNATRQTPLQTCARLGIA